MLARETAWARGHSGLQGQVSWRRPGGSRSQLTRDSQGVRLQGLWDPPGALPRRSPLHAGVGLLLPGAPLEVSTLPSALEQRWCVIAFRIGKAAAAPPAGSAPERRAPQSFWDLRLRSGTHAGSSHPWPSGHGRSLGGGRTPRPPPAVSPAGSPACHRGRVWSVCNGAGQPPGGARTCSVITGLDGFAIQLFQH